MVNEIKFRGKSIKDGKWVYGSYVPQYHSRKARRRIDAIFYSDEVKTYRIPVDPKTVGQYIGLEYSEHLVKDKELYVGDIVLIKNWSSKYTCSKCGYKSKIDIVGEIIFTNERWCGERSEDSAEFCIEIEDGMDTVEIHYMNELLGNKFDNPELLLKEN